jgi:hypothetical protein
MSDVSATIAAALSGPQVQQQIAYALLAQQLDVARQQGAAMADLVQSVAPAGKAAGRGELLDLVG